MISDSTGDPSRPPTRGANKEYLRWRLRRIVESIYFRASTLVLILIDLVSIYNTSQYIIYLFVCKAYLEILILSVS